MLDLGDRRRNERFVSIINNVSAQPGSSIPKQSGSWYGTKATYGFFGNADITPASLQEAISSYGGSLVGDAAEVLVVHDFCQVSYGGLQAEGLGYLSSTEGRGIILYSSIAVSTGGLPLSLLYQQGFVRPLEGKGKAARRKRTPFGDKESYHWYRGCSAVNGLLGGSVRKVHIADREADIYDLFFLAYGTNADLLVRSRHNRKLGDGSHLWDAVGSQQSAAVATLQVPDGKGRQCREMDAEVRYREVELLRPQASGSSCDSVTMTAIDLRQCSALHDWQDAPLHWQLLTTVDVATVADALKCVRWYCYRWLVERFHYVLKSGTGVEDLQLKRALSLQKALHVYSIAAMRIMKLAYGARHAPQASCEVALTRPQWIVLHMLVHGDVPLPEKPPGLGQALNWIGRLGGHLGRKSDGPPGVKTVWRGYQRICDAAEVYEKLSQQNLGKG